jgi:hypothetical protein
MRSEPTMDHRDTPCPADVICPRCRLEEKVRRELAAKKLLESVLEFFDPRARDRLMAALNERYPRAAAVAASSAQTVAEGLKP